MRRRSFALAALGLVLGCFTPPPRTPERPTDVRPISISNLGSAPLGVFDPAPVKDDKNGTFWMSFSAVDRSRWPSNKRIGTRLAKSDDGGRTWSDAGPLNIAEDVDLPLEPPLNAGTWVHEVSRLLVDPHAPAERRWQLFWMRYIEVNGVRNFEHAWIARRTASAPTGPWSAEQKLMVGAAYLRQDDSIVGPPQVELHALHADLAGCAAATEPGALARPEGLYLSLYCAGARPEDGRQILLREPRDGSGWEYLGTLTTNRDAQALGFHEFSATELFESEGKAMLFLSPEKDRRYKGCLLLEVEDLAAARVARSGGALAVRRYIELDQGGMGFGGACGFYAGLASGVLYSELFAADPPFRIFATGLTP